jgi:hypothetical protein
MKKLTTVILTLTLLLTLACLAFGADVLNIGSGARSIALGRTFTSTVADGYGIFGNPASLKGVTTGEVVSMYGTMNGDISYSQLGYVLPTGYGKFFIGYDNNMIPGITTTTLDATTGRPTAVSNFDVSNGLLLAGYENQFNKLLTYGLRLKYYQLGSSNLANISGSGLNADVGLIINPTEQLNIGIVGNNLIPGTTGALKLHNGETEDLPLSLDLGLGCKLRNLNLYADLSVPKNLPAEAKAGVEWNLNRNLALRLGAEQKTISSTASYVNGSAGVGINIGVLGIDYAYYYDSNFNPNSRHFVSLTIKTPSLTAAEPEFKQMVPAAVAAPLPISAPAPTPTPAPKPETAKRLFHYVSSGDTIIKIAEKYYGDWYSYHKLAELNEIKDPNLIVKGEWLIIPYKLNSHSLIVGYRKH